MVKKFAWTLLRTKTHSAYSAKILFLTLLLIHATTKLSLIVQFHASTRCQNSSTWFSASTLSTHTVSVLVTRTKTSGITNCSPNNTSNLARLWNSVVKLTFGTLLLKALSPHQQPLSTTSPSTLTQPTTGQILAQLLLTVYVKFVKRYNTSATLLQVSTSLTSSHVNSHKKSLIATLTHTLLTSTSRRLMTGSNGIFQALRFLTASLRFSVSTSQ